METDMRRLPEAMWLQLARPSLAHLHPFQADLPDLPVEAIRQRLGKDHIVKLSFNENPYGPSPRAMEAMQAQLHWLHLYQDATGDALRRALATDLGVEPDQIILTNGADELILLLTLAFLDPCDEVIIPSPTFGQYQASSIAMGAQPVLVPLVDYHIDMQNILKALSPKTKMVFLCNPNNPTGTIVVGEELRYLIEQLPENVLLVVDEAYIDYVTDSNYASALDYLSQRANLIVIRTFSKLHALAAARVGFGISHSPLINLLHRVRPPFNVNRIGQAGALASWQDIAYQARMRELNTTNREYLYNLLTAADMPPIPSQANFVLVDTKQEAATVYKKLEAEGIIVRDAAGFGLPRHLRITVGRQEDLSRLGQVLQADR
ncbi:MAG: histidinol-phosphate transaminase [Firmicutes bacterium]|nr:histidinol-phosphate transaminase [Bacillota bacterium]